jgi:hypothetical protein
MRISTLAACLFLAAASVVPFRPWAAKRTSSSVFEIQVASDHSGLVQLYYQLGPHIVEEDSVIQPIVAGHPALLRFSLPCGTIQALRFDPLDREAHLTLGEARVVDGSGRTQVSISPEQFGSMNQIQRLEVRAGKLYVETTPGGTDPELSIKLAGPLRIPRPFWGWGIVGTFAGLVACLLLIDWAKGSRSVRLGERAHALWAKARAAPGRAVLLAALLGTVGANYPVLFAGRSLITPGFSGGLLYGQPPYLPGIKNPDIGTIPDAHGADVGALLWYHLPASVAGSRAVLGDGELPLWNRYNSAGTSLLGQGQSCFGDPLQVLPILAGGAAWAWDLKFLLAKWLFACGIGLCVWRTSQHLPSALALSVSASFIGFFVYRLNHPAIFSMCYAPWILYCWLRVSGSGSARGAILWLLALIGANWTEMNSGTVKEAYVLLFSMNLAGLCVLLTSDQPLRKKGSLLGGALLAGGVFAMVGSPVWFIFYRALKVAYTGYAHPASFQLQPGMFLGLFDEAFYRPFQENLGVINPSANAFVLIGLAWTAVRWRAVMANRFARGLFLSSLPALALVFGAIPAGVISRVPFLGNIAHIDNTFSCALIVIYAVLSGMGWREAWERLGTRDGKREAMAVVILLVLAVAAFLGTAQSVLRSAYMGQTWGLLVTVPTFIQAYGGSLLGASVLLLWALHLWRRNGGATPAVVLCSIAAFGGLHWRMGLQMGNGFFDYVVRPSHRVDVLAPSPAIDAILEQRESPFRVVGFGNDFLPGWSAIYDLEGMSGPDALVNPYYRDFMDVAGVPRVWDWRYMVGWADLPQVIRVLDALNVRFYLAYRGGDRPAGPFLKRFQSSDMEVFESPTAWPRAFFTDSVAVYNDLPQFCSWLKAGDGRPFAAIEHGDWSALKPAPKVSGDLGTRKVVPAESYTLTGNTTSFTVNATGPGFIVLTEAYERSNFHATVNGLRVPYLRINHAFKGIYVDSAGTYQVAFEYYPRGLATALYLFAAGIGLIAVALAGAVFGLKPKRDPRPVPATG